MQPKEYVGLITCDISLYSIHDRWITGDIFPEITHHLIPDVANPENKPVFLICLAYKSDNFISYYYIQAEGEELKRVDIIGDTKRLDVTGIREHGLQPDQYFYVQAAIKEFVAQLESQK